MILSFEGIKNVRDISEIRRADGKALKRNKIFRGAELSEATENDIKLLKGKYGVKVIVDFRGESACSERPNKLVPSSHYYNIPSLPAGTIPKGENDTSEEFAQLMERPMEMFMKIYEALALSEESADAYKKFFHILIDNNCPSVYLHCKQGKDRTGIAMFLLLTVLGFDREDIINDYLMTNDAMKPEFDRLKNEGVLNDKHKLELYTVIMLVRRECIEKYISLINDKYGSVDSYIRNRLGIDEDKVKLLQKGYLE
ncbi:protein-tyrosine phosphatase [Hathewaya proteolytica DSM 3090]|uniref:Protein-tyrosine phosphatase n=1 Tax=Hathewaya proteolytica DSM 3090 TaxID=1121331 RepID=A0A1M6KJ11_9CLOT|nr:tyrosine-protein phosphatase [Hathewaya proteolytica]SHJ58946.1 protein-tyrosine phosphatase [Hathewaya proteolytica DSM 3090]